MLAACEDLGRDGIVAKRLDSIYRPGARTTLWRKKKCRAWLERTRWPRDDRRERAIIPA
jgi:ATP-dependent DNA ligase